MQASDVFLTLAEFSIALAGFTSIVVVFTKHEDGFSGIDRFRIQNALWASLGPALIAFSPFVFDLFGSSGTALWRACSAVFTVYLVAYFLVGRSTLSALSEADRSVLGGRRSEFIVGSGTLVNLVLQPLNVVGLLYPPQPGVFLIGLLLVLLQSITIFVRIVFIRPAAQQGVEPEVE